MKFSLSSIIRFSFSLITWSVGWYLIFFCKIFSLKLILNVWISNPVFILKELLTFFLLTLIFPDLRLFSTRLCGMLPSLFLIHLSKRISLHVSSTMYDFIINGLFFYFNYAVAVVFSSAFLFSVAALSFFGLSILLASTSLSTNSMIAIGA